MVKKFAGASPPDPLFLSYPRGHGPQDFLARTAPACKTLRSRGSTIVDNTIAFSLSVWVAQRVWCNTH